MKALTLYSDGSSRGNPGPGGAGVVIMDQQGNLVREISRFLGVTTNNEAEYQALILALENARELGADSIRVYMDSELVVKQLNGSYRVKSGRLRPLYEKVKKLLTFFRQADIQHIEREANHRADRLANQASQAPGI